MVILNRPIFDIDIIKNDDPLREEKINALNSIKDYLQGIDREISLWILGEHLYSIIDLYKLSCQKEDLTLRYLTAEYSDLEHSWDKKLINVDDRQKLNEIKSVVQRAILKFSGSLTRELKQMKEKTKELWVSDEFNGGDIAKFDARFPFSVNNGDRMKETARKILKDVLGAREAKAGKNIEHERMFEAVMENLQGVQFRLSRSGRVEIIDAYERIWNIIGFKYWMENNIIGSPNLNDRLLPAGQKKTDLLRKLEEVIEAGIKKVENNDAQSNTTANTNANDNDKVSETSDSEATADSNVSSIFDESDEEEKKEKATTDNSSVNSSDHNNDSKNQATPNLSEWQKNYSIQRITGLLKQEPAVKEEDLEAENRNWLEKIKTVGSLSELVSLEGRIEFDISKKRKIKQENAKLNEIIENPTVNAKNLQIINNNLGEAENKISAQKAKKVMIENDPELYFDTFVDWVKGEEEKLAAERKKLAETDTISEVAYNEEEKQFLAGQITDQHKREQIAERIEVKINVKKKSWSLWKWIKEQTEWLKTKARLLRKNNKVGFDKKVEQIKREIENVKNSSNDYARQVYQNNEARANQLVVELNTIIQNNQTNTSPKPGFFQPKYVIPTVLLVAGLAVAVGVIIRNKKIKAKFSK